MTQFNRICIILGTAAAAILFTPVVSVAQGSPDLDTREISAYVLSEAALAKFTRASANLGNLAKQVGASCDNSDSAKSLDESVARVNAVPGARAAIQSAGMTTREYIVFTWSLFQTGMAAWETPTFPILSLGSFAKAGLGKVSIPVTNIGSADATNVSVTITVTGGILNRINKTKTETLASLAMNEVVNITTDGMIFGIGTIALSATASCAEAQPPQVSKTGSGKVFHRLPQKYRIIPLFYFLFLLFSCICPQSFIYY